MTKAKATNKVFYGILSVLILLGIGFILAYGVNSADPVTSVAKKAFPAVVVGGNVVSVYEWEMNQRIAKKVDTKATLTQINRIFLDNKKKERVFQTLGLKSNPSLVYQEYRFDKSNSEQDYSNLLKNYFSGDERLFIKYVVIPNFYDAKLRLDYNQDTKTNSDEYNKAKSMLDKINKGEDFDTLAKTASEDTLTGQLGGDLGVVSESQVLPEFLNILNESEAGKVVNKIAISRYGYHILFPKQTALKEGQKVWYLKHILVKTKGYDKWIDSKLADVSVWRIK